MTPPFQIVNLIIAHFEIEYRLKRKDENLWKRKF